MKVFGIVLIIVSLFGGLIGWYNVNENSLTGKSREALLMEITERQIRDNGGTKSEYLADLEKLKEERIQLRNIAFGVAAVFFLSGIICVSASASRVASTAASAKQPPILPVAEDIKSKLAKLTELRATQLITPEDFERQKSVLLENYVKR